MLLDPVGVAVMLAQQYADAAAVFYVHGVVEFGVPVVIEQTDYGARPVHPFTVKVDSPVVRLVVVAIPHNEVNPHMLTSGFCDKTPFIADHEFIVIHVMFVPVQLFIL